MKNRLTYKTHLILIEVLMLINISSCEQFDYIMGVVECGEFSFQGEEYWFPEKVGENVTFLDTVKNEKVFEVAKKEATHVTEYNSRSIEDCGCEDYSKMTLISDSDTILLDRYSSDFTGSTFESIIIKTDSAYSIFSGHDFIGFENLSIDSVQIDACKIYHVNEEGGRINKVILAKGIGIVRYINQDGAVWTNSDLSIQEENNLDSFEYTESTCGF